MPESTTERCRRRSQPKRFGPAAAASSCRRVLAVAAFALFAGSRSGVTSFSTSSPPRPMTPFVRSAVSVSANFRGGGGGGRSAGGGTGATDARDRRGGTRQRGELGGAKPGSLAASLSQRSAEEEQLSSPPRQQRQIPITVLSGFLGSGKTSLLQHLLTNGRGLRIAVIVNDVASLNVDSKLVMENVAAPASSGGVGGASSDGSRGRAAGIVQLENGCACCSLSGELLNSVAELVTLSDMRGHADDDDDGAGFDHIVVELSGVAEPGAIRANFQEAAMYGMPVLERVRLDTMITVIDCSTFLQNLRSAKGATPKDAPELYYRTDEERAEAEKLDEGGWAEGLPSKLLQALNTAPSSPGASSGAGVSGAVGDLLVEQTEVADIVLLNKVDLLGDQGANADDVLREIREIVTALNPRARTMVTEHGQVGDILDVLGSAGEDGGGVAEAGVVDDHRDFVAAALGHAPHTHDDQGEAACVDLDCADPSHSHSHSETSHTPAESSETSGCADPDPSHSHDHSHSHSHSESCADPGCTDPSHDHSSNARENTSGIGTFVYSARRPFHPARLLRALRMLPVSRGVPMDDAEEKKRANDGRVIETFGRILRSKGFAWTADSNTAALYWSHAGSSFEMQCLGRWWATLPRDQWPQEATDTILADFDVPTHDEHSGADSTQTSVGDRRQEVVFIGPGMDTAQQQADVRKVMDECLLQDEEWELYKAVCKQEDKLKNTFGELPIQARMVTY